MNNVTLFSNGIGHFTRKYSVPKDGKEINLSFNSDSLGDAAASLQIWGEKENGVSLVSPPSFTPANSQATALVIKQDEGMRSLLRQLCGAKIKVTNTAGHTLEGSLAGIDKAEKRTDNGLTILEEFVVVSNGSQLTRWSISSVKNVDFEQESVQTEIEKALKASFQKIKPGSTMMDIHLKPQGDAATECFLQYTIPVASWKMCYSIRQTGDSFVLEGSAIIDNNTDEDWKEFNVSVVTGNPISFRTDIADVVVPNRRLVNIVDRMSLGNVDVEEGYVDDSVLECATEGFESTRSARSLGAKRAVSNVASFGMAAPADPQSAGFSMAGSPGVESKEVGDFCVFTCSEPVTILANKSAIVSMFSVPLKRAGVVLFYNEKNHSERPYRAVKFKNETEYTLNKGKVTVSNEGIFSGECVLDTTKPQENRMIPHCLENSVKITKENVNQEDRITSLSFSEGTGFVESTTIYTTTYRIANKKDEEYKLALEHKCSGKPTSQVAFDGVEIKEDEKLVASNSRRIYFDLEASQTLKFTVTEVDINVRETRLGIGWFDQHVIRENSPLVENESLKACLAVQEQINDKQNDLQELQSKAQSLSTQVDRLRKNLQSVKDTDVGNAGKWAEDMGAKTDEITEIESEKIPALNEEIRVLQKELANKLVLASGNWKAEQKAEVKTVKS